MTELERIQGELLAVRRLLIDTVANHERTKDDLHRAYIDQLHLVDRIAAIRGLTEKEKEIKERAVAGMKKGAA